MISGEQTGFSRPGAHIARFNLTGFEVTGKRPLFAVGGVEFSDKVVLLDQSPATGSVATIVL